MTLDPRTTLHAKLKDITIRYGNALDRYRQAMNTGQTAKADDALSDMQDIEQRVTIIERPAR
jgi:hypothetical protein